jgi:hypothetical protein
MKKPLTIPDERQPRNITRADLVMTEGFGLEVDGRMKTVFPTLEAAQKRARDLKAEFPMLQVKVYDAVEKKLPSRGSISHVSLAARRHIGKVGLHLATRLPLPQHDGTTLIVAYDVERVLADIDADRGDHGIGCLRHGVLLVFGAPCQLRLLAGQEHGRTIPLADVSR